MSHSAADELETAFADFAFTHVFSVITSAPREVAIESLQAVAAQGGALEALALSRSAGAIDHSLKVSGLRPHEARQLSARLAELPGVVRATVEHHLARR